MEEEGNKDTKLMLPCVEAAAVKNVLTILHPLFVLQEIDSIKSTNKICRQLIYHLTPHSKWTRQSVPRRKTQAW